MTVWISITKLSMLVFQDNILKNNASNHTIEHPQQTCNCINWNAPHSFLHIIHITSKTRHAVGVQQCWEWFWIVTREVVTGRAGSLLWQISTNIYQTYTNVLEVERTPVDHPRCEARGYMVETIAVNFETLACVWKAAMRSRKSQKVKGHFFFRLLRLQDWQSAQDVNQLRELSRWTTPLRLILLSTKNLHKTLSSLRFIRFAWSDMNSQTSGMPETAVSMQLLLQPL